MHQAIGYTRVSTKGQGKSGFGIDAQRTQLREFAKQFGYRIRKFYCDVESAMGENSFEQRPEVLKAIASSRSTGWPIIVPSLDRFSRDTASLERIIKEGELNVISADKANGTDENYVSIKSEIARAQREGEMISKRTKAGLDRARAKGVKLGNPKILNVAQPKGAAANKATAKIRTLEFDRMVSEARARGANTAEKIADELNRIGYKTARRGPWTKSNVYRALNKIKELESTRNSSRPIAAIIEPSIADDDRRLTPKAPDRIRKATAGQPKEEAGFTSLEANIDAAIGGYGELSPDELAYLEKLIEDNKAKVSDGGDL